MHRRQAVVGSLRYLEDWCNAAVPNDAAECSRQMEVGGAVGWVGWRMGAVGWRVGAVG